MVEITYVSKPTINEKLIKKAVKKFLKYYSKAKYDVSIVFIGDAKIKKINHKYRKINKTTDILSFEGEGNFLGEIFINYGQIKRQAKKYKNTTQEELIYILVHGLLHLLSYNDNTKKEREKMRKEEERFLKILDS